MWRFVLSLLWLSSSVGAGEVPSLCEASARRAVDDVEVYVPTSQPNLLVARLAREPYEAAAAGARSEVAKAMSLRARQALLTYVSGGRGDAQGTFAGLQTFATQCDGRDVVLYVQARGSLRIDEGASSSASPRDPDQLYQDIAAPAIGGTNIATPPGLSAQQLLD